MRLDPMRVQDLRVLVLSAARLVAALLICWGVFQIIARLTFAMLGAKQLDQAWSLWTGVGTEHGMFRGTAAVLVGCLLAILSRSLAAWIVRPPDTSCPRCGYEGAGEPAGVCNECGLSGFHASRGG